MLGMNQRLFELGYGRSGFYELRGEASRSGRLGEAESFVSSSCEAPGATASIDPVNGSFVAVFADPVQVNRLRQGSAHPLKLCVSQPNEAVQCVCELSGERPLSVLGRVATMLPQSGKPRDFQQLDVWYLQLYLLGDSGAVQSQLENVQQIQASKCAFAAILGDRSVVTWGDAYFDGDSSFVQHQLKNVQQVQASERAFAAILGNGSVVTWGDAHHGGDSSAVQGQLKNVQQIHAAEAAFAAILGD
eukprot:s4522_g8.t1